VPPSVAVPDGTAKGRHAYLATDRRACPGRGTEHPRRAGRHARPEPSERRRPVLAGESPAAPRRDVV